MNFEDDILSLKKRFTVLSGELNKLSNDNSFYVFLDKFMKILITDLRLAIEDRENEIKIDELLFDNNIYRYTATVSNILNYKAIGSETRDLFFDMNNVILNWINMAEENNLILENSKVLSSVANINDMNTVIKAGHSLENLIRITDNLINKAKDVLAVAPEQFNLSKSLLGLIHENEDEE